MSRTRTEPSPDQLALPWGLHAIVGSMAKKPQPVTWQIIVIRKKAEPLGTVEVPDANAAIRTAIKQFGIADPEMQKRSAARRLV